MSSSDSSQFLLPRFLRSGRYHWRRVYQLHFALAVRRLAVAQDPDVGGDAGVVEHVERQGDDRLQPVVLDDPAADVALALPGVACEERAAVVDLGDAASPIGVCSLGVFILLSMLARNIIWPSLERVMSE